MHESRPNIERYANQSEWLENTLLDMEEQMDTSSFPHTPSLQDINAQRTREEGSCSNKDTTNNKFEMMYRKSTKLKPVNEQEEVIDTIAIIDIDTVIKENALASVSKETHQPSTSSAQIIHKRLQNTYDLFAAHNTTS